MFRKTSVTQYRTLLFHAESIIFSWVHVILNTNTNLPCNLISLCIMLQGNWKISSIIKLPEGGRLGRSFLESPSLRWTLNLCIKEYGKSQSISITIVP